MKSPRFDIKDCLEGCTDAQREAITHVAGPLLVLAGAGSGKTRVITRRIAHLIGVGVRPNEIMAITFTNKAADEMRGRVSEFYAERGPWVSTFHAMCARMLRSHAEKMGFTRSFTIYDAADTIAGVKQALKDCGLSQENWSPSAMANAISLAKNRLLTPAEFKQRAGDVYQQAAAKVYERYDALLRKCNAMDFDDLLMKVVQLLREDEAVRRGYAERFRHILIDEYQDTNHAQYVIARQLASAHRNICATGDPDQSIYGWRGADLNNILRFERDYADAKVVRLEQNYRSTKTILAAASALISHNLRRKEKDLWTQNPRGAPVRLFQCEDEEDEAEQIAQDISRLVEEGLGGELAGPVNLCDVAILYRTNAQSRSLEAALRDRGIAYQIVAGVAFYQRREIKDLLAYLRLLVNPADDVSTERVVNVPPRGLGKASVTRAKTWAAEHGTSLLDALARPKEVGLTRARTDSAMRFTELLCRLREMPPRPVAELVSRLIKGSDYLPYLHRAGPDEAERAANCEELVNAAAQYDAANPEGDLAGFLEGAALVSDVDRMAEGVGAVTLMTLHAAKGLEFPVIYIVGLEEGLIPLIRADEDEGDEEEERRLCFVGMTRAKRALIMTHAEMRRRFGREAFTERSRFLDELPEEAVEYETLVTSSESQDVGQEETGELAEAGEWRNGDRVLHPEFGPGRIVALSGFGETQRALVNFVSAGPRHLVLQYAKLEKLDQAEGPVA